MVVSEASDDDLIRATATGDKAAFTRLVTRHRTRLLALIIRTLGNRAGAEDIVQEVFTRAWVHAPTWQARDQNRASYAAWLSRVAVNLSIDQMRRVRTVPLDGIDEPEDVSPRPDSLMMARERAKTIGRAIQALPERQRIALSLAYDAELSNVEGAAAMATSVGAFELLLVRARRTLRQTLSNEA